MPFIRCGYFPDFLGADTILIDVDRQGLGILCDSLRRVTASPVGTLWKGEGIDISLATTASDSGMLRTGPTSFRWERSQAGWFDVLDKIQAMLQGPCHHYLDGPRDEVQVLISMGEYGERWWASRPT